MQKFSAHKNEPPRITLSCPLAAPVGFSVGCNEQRECNPTLPDNMLFDAESVEQSALVFVTFGDGALFLLKRSDSRYAIMFVIFDDKKNAGFAIALRTLLIDNISLNIVHRFLVNQNLSII